MPRATSLQSLVIWAAVLLVLAGFWLRVQRLDAMPPGLSGDEAKKIIDSAHIAQTGKIVLYQDRGRPEPLFQFYGGFTSLLFGNSVWVFRFESALWGLLTLPAVFWASRQCFAEQAKVLRALVGLVAVIVAATALGHITISRSLYRAVPLTLFLALFIGFVARALRRHARSDYILAAIFLALAIHCYSSALVVPFIFIPVFLQLVLFQRSAWRRWLPGLMIVGAVLLLLTAPVAYLLLAQPSAIIARAQDVASSGGISLARGLDIMVNQFFVRGDGNPQYNVAEAPLIDSLVAPLFGIGLIYLCVHFRRTSSVLLLGLLILCTLPALATSESVHGLRIYAEFAVIPLIAACGIILPHQILTRLTRSARLTATVLLLSVLVLFTFLFDRSTKTYTWFWEGAESQGPQWYVYDRALSFGESFFRSDRQFLTNWIKAQNSPLLIPLEELNGRETRAHLMSRFPFVDSMGGPEEFSEDTIVVIPWSLERGRFLDDSLHFALLDGDTISILPPLDQEFFGRLMRKRADATILEYTGSRIPVVAEYFTLDAAIRPAYQEATGIGDPLARFNGDLDVVSWHGPATISGPGTYHYSLDWSVFRTVGHNYGGTLQLLTPDWKRIVGDEQFIYRWLYPTIAWDRSDQVPAAFGLTLEQPLAPGAYHLAAGSWYVNGGLMLAHSFVGESIPTLATIGWIKAPQASQPTIPTGATPVNAIFAGSFTLSHVDARFEGQDRLAIMTYWTAPQERVGIDATSFLHVFDDDATLLAQNDRRPWRGQYPTHIWDNSETVVIKHQFDFDRTDSAHLYTGLYTQPDFERLTAEQYGAQLTDHIVYLGNLSTLLKRD